ncbi:anti-sigma factor [Pelagibius sp. Alg239-R121]|uniref:anti-sigma factor family protein n=1 Tax=Pelagibius sp. Alg239-R121 TaxID=2993448 RepID=UPI0024A647E1|nr:zf-HC2 domain-containing protein [Pelagibius sp. Alg239-R121]
MAKTNCELMRQALSAYVDGELPAHEARIVEGHLTYCSGCSKAVEETIAIERRLQQTCRDEQAPDGLWGDVMLSISDDRPDSMSENTLTEVSGQPHRDDTPDQNSTRVSRFGRRRAGAIAAGFLLALGVGFSSPYWSRLGGKNPLVVEPVNDFITFKMSERSLDMAASDPAKLKEWFNGKVDFRLPLDRSETDGFRLVGSRLCYFLNRRLSALMYERSGDRVSLYVMTGEGLEIPEGTWEPLASQVISSSEVKGYSNLIWQSGDLVYALVSDQPKNEMLRFIGGLKLKAAATGSPILADRSRKQPNRTRAQLAANHET